VIKELTVDLDDFFIITKYIGQRAKDSRMLTSNLSEPPLDTLIVGGWQLHTIGIPLN
jgi:hypothetical protein